MVVVTEVLVVVGSDVLVVLTTVDVVLAGGIAWHAGSPALLLFQNSLCPAPPPIDVYAQLENCVQCRCVSPSLVTLYAA